MSDTETITVPHLGTSTIGYRLGKAYDASLPTLIMVNSPDSRSRRNTGLSVSEP
jgi:hypothetical protein